MSSLTSIALAIGTLALAWPTAARAQHCHIDTAPRPTTTATQPPPVAISVGTRVTAGVARVPELTTPMMIDRAYQGADLVVDVAWLGHTDNGMDQQIGSVLNKSPDSQLAVGG